MHFSPARPAGLTRAQHSRVLSTPFSRHKQMHLDRIQSKNQLHSKTCLPPGSRPPPACTPPSQSLCLQPCSGEQQDRSTSACTALEQHGQPASPWQQSTSQQALLCPPAAAQRNAHGTRRMMSRQSAASAISSTVATAACAAMLRGSLSSATSSARAVTQRSSRLPPLRPRPPPARWREVRGVPRAMPGGG